jgi:hypothetical protein
MHEKSENAGILNSLLIFLSEYSCIPPYMLPLFCPSSSKAQQMEQTFTGAGHP